MEAALVLLAVVVGALVTTLPWYLANRQLTQRIAGVERSRENAETRLFLRVRELENAHLANSWGEYAQLQELPSAGTQATNSFGEARAEEAHGETPEDIVNRYLEEHGVDMEGPIVG